MHELTSEQKAIRADEWKQFSALSTMMIDQTDQFFQERNSQLRAGLECTSQDVEDAYALVKHLAPYAHEHVLPSWWEHLYASAAIAKKGAEALQKQGFTINPQEAEITLIFHDLFGRFIAPHRYGTNDLFQNHVMLRTGLSRFGDNTTSIFKTLDGTIDFNTLTPMQRLFNWADNLGKVTPDGRLFTNNLFYEYLDNQQTRYVDQSHTAWLTEKYATKQMYLGELTQKSIIDHTNTWFYLLHIQPDEILNEAKTARPTIIYLLRHGATDTKIKDHPNKELIGKDMLYNMLDANGQEVPISDQGRDQMRTIAQAIANRKIQIDAIYSSDLLRTRQSVAVLFEHLVAAAKVDRQTPVHFESQLQDVRAQAIVTNPAWYLMESFLHLTGGNMYIGNYPGVETMHEAQKRYVQGVIKIIQKEKRKNHHRILIQSHGDAMRFFIAYLDNPTHTLTPEDYPTLAKTDYVNKGEGWELIFDPQGAYITRRRLPDMHKSGAREN